MRSGPKVGLCRSLCRYHSQRLYTFAPAELGPDILGPQTDCRFILLLPFAVRRTTTYQLEQKRSAHFALSKHKGGKQLRSALVSYSSIALINFSKAKSNALAYESYKVHLLQAVNGRSQSFCSRFLSVILFSAYDRSCHSIAIASKVWPTLVQTSLHICLGHPIDQDRNRHHIRIFFFFCNHCLLHPQAFR